MKKTEQLAALRVALYIRVSRQEQAIKGLSLGAQQEDLEEYARSNGWIIQGIYVDAAKTARKSLGKWENFPRMLEAVKHDQMDMILFTRLDRWFRSVADYYKVMETLEAHMLSHLELSPKHKTDLLARGLSEERIEQNMYRSLPLGNVGCRFLTDMLADFHNLGGILGFYVDKSGCWNIAGHGGLLIPYCDKSSLSCIHVTGNIHAKTAYLTEGALKGDVASFPDNDALFICFSGVNAIGGLTKTLKDLSLSEVVIALDMDF